MWNNDGYLARKALSPSSFPPAAALISGVKLLLPNLPATWEIESGVLLFISTSMK